MRVSRMKPDSSGVCGRLSRDISRLFHFRDWLLEDSSEEKPRSRRRAMMIEPLEERRLMDAAGLASLVSSTWFQDVSDQVGTQHAGVATWTAEGTIASAQQGKASTTSESNLYDWIVQFDTASLGGVSSVAQTTSLLAGGGIDFEAIRGLGMVGLVLVRSAGESLSTVENYLANNVHVAGFEQDALGQIDTQSVPNDPNVGQLWGMTKIDARDAWGISTGSQSVVVAVIDTGVDYTHPDLAANIWTNPGETAGNGRDDDGNGFADDLHGYDFVNNDGDPMDDNSHGTHVSGTIAAVGNNSRGVAGVNWSASIMPLKFLDGNGSGFLSDAVRAINYATMMRSQKGVNIRVINASWGGGGFSSSMDTAIRAAGDAGILFVTAAGNDGTNNDASPQYPANYSSSNVISVAASDQNDHLASFSCYGATTVDVAAPGVSILSTIPNNQYAYYSGTSMATPEVAGVAALAWSMDPSASVADVKNAILQGADPIAALSGKVLSGGRLNAYNTLNLLKSQLAQGPKIGSISISPNSVMVGSPVTLAAHGVTDSAGTVTGVYFSWDANNDGQYDAGDPTVGCDNTIVGGEAGISLDTSLYAPGTQRFFASALDGHSQWSPLVTTTLTVLAADDHGNTASTATPVGAPSSTSGRIDVAGDVDWFKFQAVAGRSYVFSTQLGTLNDSTLGLYDVNGAARLAFNDDYGSSSASQIAWTAPAGGTYFLCVAGYGNTQTGSYTLNIQAQNVALVLSPIGNRTMPHAVATLTIPLSTSDADGNSLTWSAQAMAIDPLAQKAYNLDQQLGLHSYPDGNYYYNIRAAGEKYMLGNDGLYFILPNGGLYRWGGSIATSTLVDTLSPAYHANPGLLLNATSPTLAPIANGDASAQMSGNVLTITRAANYIGDFYVQVNVANGTAAASETFKVSATNSAPTLTHVNDQTLTNSQHTLSLSLSANDPDGDSLAWSAQAMAIDPLAQKAYNLDQQLGLHSYPDGNYYYNIRAAGEKYMLGNDGLYFILPNGGLYRWGGSIATSTLVDTLSPVYHANPALLHNATSPTLAPIANGDASAQMSGNVLTITRAANYAGDFYICVNVTDGLATASETFKVSVTNSAPVLTRIGDQTMLISQSTLQLPLNVRDPDGDALALSAQAMAIDPLAQKAYNLDQQLGLHTYPDGNYYYNIRAAGEKYMLGNDGMYFILPNGGLYRWGGSIAASTLVDTLSPAYHANPALLHDAQQPSLTSLADNGVAVSLTNNVLLINRDFGYVNDFFVRVSASDGISTASETFRVSTTSSASLKSAAFESAIPMVAEMTTDHGNDSATTSFNTALAWLACTGGEGPGYGRHDLSGGANDWTSGADIPVCQPASAPISGRSALLDAVFARLSSLDSAPDATQSSPTALDRQLREVFSSRLAETPLILAGRLSLEIDDNSSAGEPFAGEEKSPVFGPRSWDSIEQDALDLVFDSLSECRESLGPRLL